MQGSPRGWQGVNRLDEDLLVWNYQLTPDQLPHWTREQVQPLDAPGWPRSIQSTWSRPGGGHALCDVFESASRTEAHTAMLRLLGHVESAQLDLDDKAPFGDVVFARAPAPVSLFARANVIFFIRAADRAPLPIRETAAELDEQLISKPAPPRGQPVPRIERFGAEATRLAPGESVALEVSAVDPLREALWYKCFTPSGTLRLSDGRPVYTHTSSGPPQLSLYAVAPGRGATRRDLALRSR